jgi:hypothetical protein
VWRVAGFEHPSRTARWRRFAAGLHHALGIAVDRDGIFVLGRDQITRLHDLNRDGEADFYECFSNAYRTSPAGHDFICGLQRDAAGNFYTASGNQGLVRITADGQRAEVIATGFRNPDGLGILPDGTLTVPCSEGDWTPASMICAVPPAKSGPALHFGYPGPKDGRAPELPLAYLPRGLDNSSGGQTTVFGDAWGPLQGQLLHFSFGAGSMFLVPIDEVRGRRQGAVVPLPGRFASGVCRSRFNPADGHLYLTGLRGWQTAAVRDGCFQRVRYQNNFVAPIAYTVGSNAFTMTFSEKLDRELAEDIESYSAEMWNYRWTANYGSPDFSVTTPGKQSRDPVQITSARLQPDGKTVLLTIPALRQAMQFAVRYNLETTAGTPVQSAIYATINHLK